MIISKQTNSSKQVCAGAGFEKKVRYQTALYHQNMAIAHLLPKQKRTLATLALCAPRTRLRRHPGTFFSGCSAGVLFATSKRPMAIAHLRKSSKYGHSAPVPEAEAFARQARSLCAYVPEGTSSKGVLFRLFSRRTICYLKEACGNSAPA